MTAAQIHAAILGAAIALSCGIFFARRSNAQRDQEGSVVVEQEAPSPEGETPPASDAGQAESRDRASSLMREAREIIQAVQRLDNNEAQMLEARKLIDAAHALLESLPPEDPDVQALKRDHGVLQLDAVKAAKF